MKDQGMYIIRTQEGILIAELSNDIAQKVIKQCKGHFRPLKYEGKPEKTAFQLDENSSWGFPGFNLCLFAGYVLIPD